MVVSVASFVETSIAIETGFGVEGLRDLDLLLGVARVELVELDIEQAHAARRAGRSRATSRAARSFPRKVL